MIDLAEYVYERPNYTDFLTFVSKIEKTEVEVNKKYKGEDALYWALDSQLEEISTWLLDHGAEASFNSVYAAAQRGFFDILKRLVDMGAEFDNFFKVGGFPPLAAACSEAAKYIRLDLQVTKKVNGKDVVVTDPKEIEAFVGKDRYPEFIKIVEYLLKKGANPNFKTLNDDMLTAMHWCAYRGGVELLELLFQYKADPNVKSKAGLIPLHYACRSKHRFEEAKMLIENGSNLNSQEDYGFTPLHEAAENNCEEILKMLLEAGADPSIGLLQALSPYAAGDNPREVAKKKGYTNLVKIFDSFAN